MAGQRDGVVRVVQRKGRYLCRTEARDVAIANNYAEDVRSTVDGFPVVILYRLTAESDLVFVGKYNLNNDKSTESVFGFTDIPGFDNSRVQCWEVLNNGNDIANFITADDFDNKWEDAFEARYPDGSKDVSDLKELTQWLVSTRTNPYSFGDFIRSGSEGKNDGDPHY